jgi:DNA-binding response OmpR family regulator
MSSNKILVVDDAAMIQKVVEMTLEGHGFDLFRCLNLPELKKMLKADEYQLILLDYSLSQDLSGADLLKFIRSVDPRVPIVVMVSVLEELNENILDSYNIAAKLEKPFRNQALIQICRDHIYKGSYDDEETNEDEGQNDVIEEESQLEVEEPAHKEDLSDWVVDTTNTNLQSDSIHELINDSLWDETEPEISLETEEPNHLVNELVGWGMEIPRKIGKEDKIFGDRPPIIQETSALNLIDDDNSDEVELDIEEETILPTQEDLSYPDVNQIQEELEVQDKEAAQPKIRLIPVDELASDSDNDDDDSTDDGEMFELSDDDTDPSYNVLEKFGSDLKQEIESEISPEDFWAAEETGSFGVDSDSATVSGAIERTIPETSDNTQIASQLPVISKEEILEKLKEDLTPIIEKWLNDNYKQAIERVAWEVIPDLAENLIRQEIKSISDSVKQ